MKRRQLGLLAFFATSLLGCQARPRVLFPTAESALSRLRENGACSKAVQGEAALSFSGDGRRLNGRVLFLAARPDKLRLDAFSSFGVTLSTLTSDGQNFGLYSLEDKTFFYGPARTCNVRRFTRVPAPPFALVELFRGQPPVLQHQPGQASIGYQSPLLGSGYYQILVTGAHQAAEELRLGVHPDDLERPLAEQRLRLLRVEVMQAKRTLYKVDLSGHATAKNAPITLSAEERALGALPPPASGPACEAELPRAIQFFVPESGYELGFRSEEIWHNPPLGPDVFSQEIPGGVRPEQSVCTD